MIARRTSLRRISKKREAENRVRAEFVRIQLAKRPHCEVSSYVARASALVPADMVASVAALMRGCTRRSTELHEPMTRARAPGLETIISVENSVSICRQCHNWVHDNPMVSTVLGLLVRSTKSSSKILPRRT